MDECDFIVVPRSCIVALVVPVNIVGDHTNLHK